MSIRTAAPEGSEVLDLGAARAARAEGRADKPLRLLKLDAGFVEVRAEVDVFAAEDFRNLRIRAGLSKLLADPEDVEALITFGVSDPDVEAIIDFIAGKSLGE